MRRCHRAARAARRSCALLIAMLLLIAPRRSDAQPPATAGAEPPDTLPWRGQPAQIDGVVRDTLGQPLEGAELIAIGLGKRVRSDAQGGFTLGGLTRDSVLVVVRRLGYAPATFRAHLAPGRRISIAVSMVAVSARLAAVRVEAQAPDLVLREAGFFERQRRGRGVFRGPEYLGRHAANTIGVILNSLPRPDRLICPPFPNRPGCPIMLHRVLSASRRATYCVPDVWVDGRKRLDGALQRGGMVLVDDFADPGDVIGLEIYRNWWEAPEPYRRLANDCGTVLLWTKYYSAADPGDEPTDTVP